MDSRLGIEKYTFCGVKMSVSNSNCRFDGVNQSAINIPRTRLVPSRSLLVSPLHARVHDSEANLQSTHLPRDAR
jgi:hypothetical protein